MVVKSADIVTFAVGIAIVIVIAILANPQTLAGLHASGPVATPTPSLQIPVSQMPVSTPSTPPVQSVTTQPVILPTRILYTSSPLAYPIYLLPENLGTYGASDIPLRNRQMATFGYVTDTHGGLTNVFTVPYPIWAINTTVIANISPQYGNYRMALCYAQNGTVITGDEILNRGTSYHIVEVSNAPMYMIISTTSVDLFRINFETPVDYYSQYPAMK